MVVEQAVDADVDRIVHALADGTRRDILALAVGGRYRMSALANARVGRIDDRLATEKRTTGGKR
jgi:DNA-binding transcriptional ArsR family regulator